MASIILNEIMKIHRPPAYMLMYLVTRVEYGKQEIFGVALTGLAFFAGP